MAPTRTPPPLPRPPRLRLPPGRLSVDRLLPLMVEDGLLKTVDAARARMAAREHSAGGDMHPLVVLASLKLPRADQPGQELALEAMTEWLAGLTGHPYLRIDPTRIDVPATTALVSHAYARRHRILPVAVDAERVRFATSEPTDTRWVEDLRPLLRREIDLLVANPLDLHRYTMEFYGVTRSVRGAHDGAEPGGLPSFEALVELGRTGEVGADDRHIVHIVDWLLQYAYDQRASDIHLEPRREISRMRFRIDGVLHSVFEMPTPVMTAVVSRIKVLGRLDLGERRRPQDGRIKTRSPGGREVEMRLSTMPTAFGEKVVLRIFDPDTAFRPIEELGFSAREAAVWNDLVERPNGIVLVTGPTGSGKTTTLYSTLRRLALPEVNVCTVEDPIEMIATELNQMQVQPAIGLDFASGVRTLLRQDPDVIMVGEIRDLETAQMAVQASLTGHLVLSTLHTNDAPAALTRLLDLGVPHYLIASTLNGVLAQRLVRTLCRHCKAPRAVDAADWLCLIGDHAGLPPPTSGMGPVGCLECRRTGYLGRVGLYELLVVSTRLRAQIGPDLDLASFRATAIREGMRPLRVAAAEKVSAGVTTLEETISVLPPAE
jgi:general secretion pathway protein E